jgi:hypothetical protein
VMMLILELDGSCRVRITHLTLHIGLKDIDTGSPTLLSQHLLDNLILSHFSLLTNLLFLIVYQSFRLEDLFLLRTTIYNP